MKAVLLHQSITAHDAVGNDMAHMYEILGRRHEVGVYCDYLLRDDIRLLDRSKLLDLCQNKENLLIYHHSNFWEEGEIFLKECQANVVIRYHNITPPRFFEGYSTDYSESCKRGREQTCRFMNMKPSFLWLGASCYNLADINLYGHPCSAVVPPFSNLEKWRRIRPSEEVLKGLLERTTLNVLFVGRVSPNKGHRLLIEVINEYVYRYGPDIILHIIGKPDSALAVYSEELADLVSSYGIKDHVKWVHEVNDSILLSYYLGCDLYLCCSDHEGFCLPVIESQSLCLPVVAKRAAALPETMGEGGLLLKKDIGSYVDALRRIREDDAFRNTLVEKGLENYQRRFRTEIIERKFAKALKGFFGIEV